jgi:hypothetical protein
VGKLASALAPAVRVKRAEKRGLGRAGIIGKWAKNGFPGPSNCHLFFLFLYSVFLFIIESKF